MFMHQSITVARLNMAACNSHMYVENIRGSTDHNYPVKIEKIN